MSTLFLFLWTKARIAWNDRDERGDVTVSGIVQTAIYVALAIAVGAVITAAVTGKAGDIANDITGAGS